MRDEFPFLTAGDLDWAGFLLGVFDRGGSFGAVGAEASIRAVSVISSPKRAATSLSPRTFSALRGAAMVPRRAPEFIFWVLKEPNLRSITMPVITGIPSGAVIKLIGY
jgi:hypothetical protein